MAEDELKCLRNTEISVLVDEALPDILVVTYEHGLRIFKGVLLDSSKRNLPLGIQSLNPALLVAKKKPDDDPLYSVNQRFAYTDPNAKKRNMQFTSRYKKNKMTVRLRPRQVLCSKCKGICNENSENVSKKRRSSETLHTSPVPIKRSLHAPMTRSVYTEHLNTTKKQADRGASLVPRITRMTAEEERRALGGNFSEESAKNSSVLEVDDQIQQRVEENVKHSEVEHSKSDDGSHVINENQSNQEKDMGEIKSVKAAPKFGKMQLRRRNNPVLQHVAPPSEGSSEETISKIQSGTTMSVVNADSSSSNNSAVNAKTIKICYGSQGEGTILKIPTKIETLQSKESAIAENVDEPEKKPDNQTKEARRALKRAKKEAKRKVLAPSNSPCYNGSNSPRYSVGNSPRYTTVGGTSPRLGNNSPRYICTSLEMNIPRRRKHKMKHKKKHRENKDRKHLKDSEVSSSVTEECKTEGTQKLSINLKTLRSRYASSDTKEYNSSSSDEQNKEFSPSGHQLMLRLNAQTVSSASSADGARLLVGDIVWGKMRGFPWWPGKIVAISNCDDASTYKANVSWYGISNFSFLQCNQLCPYLENFDIRFNKKLKGRYKDAVNQATSEAMENSALLAARQPLGNSPSHNFISQVVSPTIASPRAIDVIS